MMRLRVVILIGTLSLAAGWMGGSLSAPVEPDASAVRRGGPRPLGVQPRKAAPLTEQLRLRLDERPRSPQSGRNPFVFGPRRSSPAIRNAVERPAESTPPVNDYIAPAAIVAPRFSLSGIASDQKDGVVKFTAILTDYGSLVLAQAGTELPGGYRVQRVDERSVVIVDAAGRETALRLH